MWLGVLMVAAAAACAGASINCRVACRECRDGRQPRDLLAVYCAMCDECKDRRREREWLIARKQDLEKETVFLRRPDVSASIQRTNSHHHGCPPGCQTQPACSPCPGVPTPPPPPSPVTEAVHMPYGCPTPPPCEEETPPPPTCPPIPQCVRKRPTLPMYQPMQPVVYPTLPACAPCVNMCPCPDKSNGESVIIGVPEKML